MIWSWFNKRHRPRQRPDLRVVVYSRPGCHLCDDAWEMLTELRKKHGFTLETTNIDEDERLRALHGEWVPVVEINGRIRFRGKINPVLFERILNAPADA